MKDRFKDQRYIESGVWKCSMSPTGSHYYMIEKYLGGYTQTCKYCGEIKNVEVPLVENLDWRKSRYVVKKGR